MIDTVGRVCRWCGGTLHALVKRPTHVKCLDCRRVFPRHEEEPRGPAKDET